MVSIDPNTGFVRAMASSGAYEDQQFNLAAQGHRQPGSAFKTFALTTAVDRAIDPDSTYYTSKPLDLNLPEWGRWEVATYGESYAGTISLHEATLASDNTVYAQLALDLGPESVADMAHDMGIETRLDGIPAETLGGLRLGVSPLEMSNAYATLASGGMRNEPIAIRKVVFPDGNVDETGQPKRKRVFEDGVAAEVTEILSDNVDGGTGTAAQTDCSYEAGKTGTTDDFNDAMFIGYTPQLSTAVWVGYPNELRSMTSVHGISVAGGTFRRRSGTTTCRSPSIGPRSTRASSARRSRSPRIRWSGSVPRLLQLRLQLVLVPGRRRDRNRELRGLVLVLELELELELLRRLHADHRVRQRRPGRGGICARCRPEARAVAEAEPDTGAGTACATAAGERRGHP